MRAKLVSIGKTKGIRIPKALIEQCELSDEVEMDIRGGSLVIRPSRAVRQGWEEAFAKMRKQGDDELLDREVAKPSDWDRKEWTW
jgi:antitoxin MazE